MNVAFQGLPDLVPTCLSLSSLPVLWADINVLAQALLPPSPVYLMLFYVPALMGSVYNIAVIIESPDRLLAFLSLGHVLSYLRQALFIFVSQLFSSPHRTMSYFTLLVSCHTPFISPSLAFLFTLVHFSSCYLLGSVVVFGNRNIRKILYGCCFEGLTV